MTDKKINSISFKTENMATDYANSLSFFMEKVDNMDELKFNTYYVEKSNVYFL